MGLNEIIENYNEQGCKTKSNDRELFIKLNEQIFETVSELNSTLKSCGINECNDVNYRYIKKSDLPREYRDEFRKHASRLTRLNYQRRLCGKGELLNLDIDKCRRGEDLLRCEFLSNEIKNVLLKNCVEEQDYLFTLSFVALEIHLLYKYTDLYKFFGYNIIYKVKNYLLLNGLKVSDRDIKMYLMLRSFNEDYKQGTMYLDNISTLEKIDFLLYEVTKGVKLFKDMNPRVVMTNVLMSLMFNLNPSDVSLYFYDFDTVTFKVNSKIDISKFIQHIKSSIDSMDVNYIPYRYIVGNSLLDNLNNIESKGILNDGDLNNGLENSNQFEF